MQWTTLQMLIVGFMLLTAAQQNEGQQIKNSGSGESRNDRKVNSRPIKKDDLKPEASGRLFDLGLNGLYTGSSTRYQPDSGSYGTYGTYQPGYAGQGIYASGYGSKFGASNGAYGGYGGYGSLNTFASQPCSSGFGSSGSGYQSFRPNYYPRGSGSYPVPGSTYPGSYSVANSYPSAYPSNLGGTVTDYSSYKGYSGIPGYHSSYTPFRYNTGYSA